MPQVLDPGLHPRFAEDAHLARLGREGDTRANTMRPGLGQDSRIYATPETSKLGRIGENGKMKKKKGRGFKASGQGERWL